MKQYSIYDNFTGSYLTTVSANNISEAQAKGYKYGIEQAYDKKEFIGITVIPPQDT